MARRGRTIDIAKVATLDNWFEAYASGYTNVKQGRDGSFLVFDPASPDTEPRRLPVPRGIDYNRILAGYTMPTSELRVRGEALRDELTSKRTNLISVAQKAFIEAENELLEAVDTWAISSTAQERAAAAGAVGKHMHSMAEQDSALQSSKYPHRHMKNESNITARMLDNISKADRILPYTLRVLVPTATLITERIIATDKL